MSNTIEAGKRVLFRARADDQMLTPGVVTAVDGIKVTVLADGTEHETSLLSQAAGDLKLATQGADPAAWMLTDGKTSTPVVFRSGCYICEDPEFAQMGLPLCRKCPECVRQGRGPGHIPADDNVCDECEYEDGPEDYPQPEPELTLPLVASVIATRTLPGEAYEVIPASFVQVPDQVCKDGEDTAIVIPEKCTVQGVTINDSSDPPQQVRWIHVGKLVNAGDCVHVPGTIEVTG